MKKKLLFVMESLGIGGAEKSLVTLLSQLDYSKYEVDLFLFRKEGDFLRLLPKEVRVLEVPEEFKEFILSPKESILALIKNKRIKLLLLKFIELINIIFSNYILKKEYIGWNLISKSINTINTKYDVAIGFLEKKSIYFVVDKVKAKNKIGWIHTDYDKVEHNHKIDCKKFKFLNKIVTVSEHCKEVMQREYPEYRNKIEVISNMISSNLINDMANEKIEDIKVNKNTTVICTVARLTEAKGIDIAINCCERLINKNKNIKWIVIGDGDKRNELQELINRKNLNEYFILMGSRYNPYPYIKNCDIYVQPSKWEGFGITVLEAKALNKPILVSNIPEFIEQIEDNKTGLIYKDLRDMINKLEMLIDNKNIAYKLSNNLKSISIDNSEEMYKIVNLF